MKSVTPNTVTLLDDGDVELWLASKEDWRLPLFAYPKAIDGTGQQVYYCSPAILNIQPEHHIALNTFFAPHRLNVDASFWVLDRAKLAEVCTKAPGLTPNYYVKWQNTKTSHDLSVATTFESPDRSQQPDEDGERFIEYFLAKSGLFDRDVMRLFWREFRRVAMLWLGAERQPLDLGFAKLVPMPYRANWKEIVLARHPKLPAILASTKGTQRTALLVWYKVYDTLTNLILASVSIGTECCYWTIETVLSADMHRILLRNERDIHKTLGPEAYAGRIFEQIQMRQNYALTVLAQYIRQTSRPCGTTRASTDRFGKTIIAHTPEGKIRPVAPKIRKVFAVAETHWQALTGPDPDDSEKVVEVKVEGLPEMSALPQTIKNVRDTGPDNAESANG